MDPDVGIWLHKLPGEIVPKEADEAFITISYRPSMITRLHLEGLLDRFLSKSVGVA